jgi:hypothetical protein
MKYGNSSTIGVDKVWMRVQADGVKVGQRFNEDDENWDVLWQSKKIDGVYQPIKNKIRFEDKGQGHLIADINLFTRDALVQFNPTHFFGEYELTTNVAGAFDRAFDLMASKGLEIDRDACLITRFDLAKDSALTENPSKFVTPLAMYLAANRESTRLEHADGVTLGNGSNQFGFYNRSLHLSNLKINHSLHPNTGRNELRCLSKGRRTWAKKFGDGDASINDFCKLNRDALSEMYLDHFKTLSTLANESIKIGIPHDNEMASDVYSEMLYFQSIHGASWMNHYLIANGIQAIADKVGLSYFIDMACEIDSQKTKKSLTHRMKIKTAAAIELNRIKERFAIRQPISYVDEYLQTFAA